jgi:hypothetical protein
MLDRYKPFAKKYFPRVYNKLLLARALYLLPKVGQMHDDGWFKSFASEQCINERGEPIPWYTYAAIDFLGERLNQSMEIFEYGCGNSTLWWSKRCKAVMACESDEGWYLGLNSRRPSNVTLMLRPGLEDGSYARSITEVGRKFDVVIVDGYDRNRCAEYAAEQLKEDGLIVWDDSERDRYKETLNRLAEKGFKQLKFIGLKALSSRKSETSILYRHNNCLGI